MPNIRIHDLRHSFTSVGVAEGASLPIIGAIMGHRKVSTTQRYAHLAHDPVCAATDLISAQIEGALSGEDKVELTATKSNGLDSQAIAPRDIQNLTQGLQGSLRTKLR